MTLSSNIIATKYHRLTMFKYLLQVVLVLCVPFVASSQEKDTAFPRTMLWEISGNGLKQSSFIYGTVHVICEKDIEIPQQFSSCIQQAKEVFFETLFRPKVDSSNTYSFLSKDTTLVDLLGEILFKKLAQTVTDTSLLDLSLLSKLKPFVASRMVEMNNLNCKATSYEKEILKIALKNGSHINGLATQAEHVDIINQIPFYAQVLQLKLLLMGLEAKRKVLENFLALYKQKDIWQLYYRTAYTASTNQPSPIKENLLDKRNIAWIPKMETAMQQQCSFFAVGCAHLPGEVGVINLLRKEGYTVTPIFY